MRDCSPTRPVLANNRLIQTLISFLLLIQNGSAATANPAPGSADSSRQGHELALLIRSQKPLPDAAASLVVRDSRGSRKAMEVRLRLVDERAGSWRVVYSAAATTNSLPSGTNQFERLTVFQHIDKAPSYLREIINGNPPLTNRTELGASQANMAFAGSDFYFSDLAMEFLHWPQQRFLRHEMKKSRSCRVLESLNLEATAESYARVLSWADVETGSLIRAEAYDAKGKRAKDFTVSKIARVNGRWQVRELRIYDYRRDSTTTLEFELELPSE